VHGHGDVARERPRSHEHAGEGRAVLALKRCR
jgi:hypothetical protein